MASGGTEANLQAIWIYRNYFEHEEDAQPADIAILCSADSHYSMDKAANLLNISIYKAEVDPQTRTVSAKTVEDAITRAKERGRSAL
ncbi:MAG: glutamate/tyrosine decarboxylase-like PLP-dependent enzyme [Roseivirga sp.]